MVYVSARRIAAAAADRHLNTIDVAQCNDAGVVVDDDDDVDSDVGADDDAEDDDDGQLLVVV